MNKVSNDPVICELRAADREYTVLNGGKHTLVEWTGHNGRRRKHQFDTTASDWRSAENARHEVRRMLREDGYVEAKDDRPRLYLADGQIYASSLDVADRFKKAHKEVLRAYDHVAADAGAEFTERNFALSSYKDASGRSLRCIEMTRDGFAILAMGFTGKAAIEWKIKFLAAFKAMEAELSQPAADLVARVDRLEGELKAATDLLLEVKQPAALPPPPPPTIVIVRKAPFVRPSILRAQRRARRAA